MASMLSSPGRMRPSDPNPEVSGRTPPPSNDQVEGAANNGIFHGHEKEPDFAEGLDYLDSRHYTERFKKHDTDYTRRLLSKYFSGKCTLPGNLFYENLAIDGEIIRASRWPCFRTYADRVVGCVDQCSNASTPEAEATSNSANVKHMMKNTSKSETS
ncbi:hypothetical protein L6164_011291 [Bauhinia variegata]|uniref:Uncharacterized protein n=1 Tax=Bauhinia variegata TaxID=167791 RepID=A0ACB9P7S3_BAUVA|nr:hypothetical protein L6164_011291 [Bauhinia variegata]